MDCGEVITKLAKDGVYISITLGEIFVNTSREFKLVNLVSRKADVDQSFLTLHSTIRALISRIEQTYITLLHEVKSISNVVNCNKHIYKHPAIMLPGEKMKFFLIISPKTKMSSWHTILDKEFDNCPILRSVARYNASNPSVPLATNQIGRCGLCRDYYDPYETDEQRMRHIPQGMPEDERRFLIELWGKDEFKKKREQAKANRSKLKMKHTCGSQSYQSKRANIEEITGAPVNEVDFFIEKHTSKKSNTFIDVESREAAGMMDTIVREHTNESGMCSLTSHEVISQVLDPPPHQGEGTTTGESHPTAEGTWSVFCRGRERA